MLSRKRGKKPDPQGTTARILAVVFAICVWQAGAVLLHNSLILPSPWSVLCRLCAMPAEAKFWSSLGFTFVRIVGGFLLALAAAVLLASLAARVPVVEVLLRPFVTVIKSVPVASFIVIALLWLSSSRLSIFIAFLMVFPVLYTNLLQGLHAAPEEMREMAQVFQLSPARRIRYVFLPALRPFLISGCRVGLGLCWKAGIAAEVIAVARSSIGGRLYEAKVCLEMTDLFAWTVVIVLVSTLFEKGFLWLMNKALDRWEGIA